MTDMPYKYLVSWETTQAEGKFGQMTVDRNQPFDSHASKAVTSFIKEHNRLKNNPIITNVFTYTDSADHPMQLMKQKPAGVPKDIYKILLSTLSLSTKTDLKQEDFKKAKHWLEENLEE